jgi:hypothetical protein
MKRAAFALAILASTGCGKSTAPSASMPSAGVSSAGTGDAAPLAAGDDAGAAPMDAREAAAWAAASTKDVDFSELPWLAQVATTGTDDDARVALDAVVELAARPRRATDPEDADELHVGCGALLDLARGGERPKERRVLAIRALRMLTDRGCVKKADIPTELDAH